MILIYASSECDEVIANVKFEELFVSCPILKLKYFNFLLDCIIACRLYSSTRARESVTSLAFSGQNRRLLFSGYLPEWFILQKRVNSNAPLIGKILGVEHVNTVTILLFLTSFWKGKLATILVVEEVQHFKRRKQVCKRTDEVICERFRDYTLWLVYQLLESRWKCWVPCHYPQNMSVGRVLKCWKR